MNKIKRNNLQEIFKNRKKNFSRNPKSKKFYVEDNFEKDCFHQIKY